jgi:hypothetical protein
MTALGILAAIFFLASIAAHLALVALLVRRMRIWRAALALIVPPLAPWWAWAKGMRWPVYAWLGAIGAYAVVVIIAGQGTP